MAFGGNHPDPRHDPLYHQMLTEAKHEEMKGTKLPFRTTRTRIIGTLVIVLALAWAGAFAFNAFTGESSSDPLLEPTPVVTE